MSLWAVPDVFATVMSYLTCRELFGTVTRVSWSCYRGVMADLIDLPRLITSTAPGRIQLHLLRTYMTRILAMELHHNLHAEWLGYAPSVALSRLRSLKTPYISAGTPDRTFPLERLHECEMTHCAGTRSTWYFTRLCARLSKSVRVLKLESISRRRISLCVTRTVFHKTVQLRLSRIIGSSTTDLWPELARAFPELRILSIAGACGLPNRPATTATWKHIAILRLTDTSLTNDGLRALLRATGGSVVHLKLRQNRQLDLSTIVELIASTCPRLLTLDIDPCYIKLFRPRVVARGLSWKLCRMRRVRLVV